MASRLLKHEHVSRSATFIIFHRRFTLLSWVILVQQ